jgi:protein-S-isoprenylcysteine O-methyltransferase Ste14
MSLLLRNLLFAFVVPGAVAVYIPWLILTAGGTHPEPVLWPAAVLIGLGVGFFAWCVWLFATVGRGTPGPWDPARHFVAVGPYRSVRNPMYLAVFLVVLGETLLFLSAPLLIYLGFVALIVQLFVVGYEEPTLTKQFGDEYRTYRRRVRRWLPWRPG